MASTIEILLFWWVDCNYIQLKCSWYKVYWDERDKMFWWYLCLVLWDFPKLDHFRSFATWYTVQTWATPPSPWNCIGNGLIESWRSFSNRETKNGREEWRLAQCVINTQLLWKNPRYLNWDFFFNIFMSSTNNTTGEFYLIPFF